MPADVSRVLVIDDDPDFRRLAAAILSAAGYETVTAADGEEALAHISSSPQPAVIVLDLLMPGSDGWQFRMAQMEEEKQAGIPVVLVSAMPLVAHHASAMHAAAWLRKPIVPQQLVDVVDGIVAMGGRQPPGSSSTDGQAR